MELSQQLLKYEEVPQVIKQYYCTPNCQHEHTHNYMWDFSKNYQNEIRERPGVCHLLDIPLDSDS